MNHDPMCPPPWKWGSGGHCEGCDLIARARADEREKAAQRIEAIAPERTDRTNLVVLAFAMACDAVRGETS